MLDCEGGGRDRGVFPAEGLAGLSGSVVGNAEIGSDGLRGADDVRPARLVEVVPDVAGRGRHPWH